MSILLEFTRIWPSTTLETMTVWDSPLFPTRIRSPGSAFAKEVTETFSHETVDANPTRIVDERYAATVRNYSYGETIPDSIYYEEYVNGWIIYRGTLYKRQVNYLPSYISVVYDGYIYAQL